jgi:hypothetical protein
MFRLSKGNNHAIYSTTAAHKGKRGGQRGMKEELQVKHHHDSTSYSFALFPLVISQTISLLSQTRATLVHYRNNGHRTEGSW